MRVVFMGTPAFAVPSLRAVASAHDVAAVFTRPDMPSGRGRVLRASPVAEAALELGLAVERPATLRDRDAVEILHGLEPEVICVVAYGLLLPSETLTIPPSGCVNVHASLLPRWRGAAPIERAILAGDVETGVAIMRMEEQLDTGPVARVVRVAVGDRSADDLRELLAREGASALLAVLDEIRAGIVRWEPQASDGVTYAGKVFADEVALDPAVDAAALVRRVRASSRSAPSRVVVAGRPLTVLGAHVSDAAVPRGSVALLDGSPALGTESGTLVLDRVVPSGRSAMTGAEYARGARLGADATWEAPR